MGRKGCAKGLPRFVLVRRSAAARIAQVLPCTLPVVARLIPGAQYGRGQLIAVQNRFRRYCRWRVPGAASARDIFTTAADFPAFLLGHLPQEIVPCTKCIESIRYGRKKPQCRQYLFAEIN